MPNLTPAERAIIWLNGRGLRESPPETVSVRVRGGPVRAKKNKLRNANVWIGLHRRHGEELGKHRVTGAREVARATKMSSLADVPGTALIGPTNSMRWRSCWPRCDAI